jgi:tripartite-type tricarboxylate transporter receptor subunit TctC
MSASPLIVHSLGAAIWSTQRAERLDEVRSRRLNEPPHRRSRAVRAAGGPTDALARALGEKLGARLGQTVVIENRAGAASIVGAQAVARSQPDGYTLLLSTTGVLALNPSIHAKLPYDAAKDFAPVGLICISSNVLSIRSSLPIKSVADLIAHAKSKPDELTFASPGVGSSSHLAAEMFNAIAGVKLRHIPYKDGSAIKVDVQEGRVDMSFGPEGETYRTVQEHPGKRRVLMVTGATRSPLFPDVPTALEAGLKGYEQSIWFGLNAPAGTPPAVLARLNKELNAVLESPQMQKELTAAGQRAVPMTPQQYEAFSADERRRYAPIIKAAGVRVE